LYKISAQHVAPPKIKIKAHYPFDLVAMDILQLPRSHGFVALLVVIDHFSKFLTAIPLRYKKSSAVVKALTKQILPHFVKIPARILTDNGPEFRSGEFNEVLTEYNIDHVYSTRYRAAGNGAVERSNRTITEFIKGVVGINPEQWPAAVSRALIVYNNTWPLEIKETPSNFILCRNHVEGNNNGDGVVENWLEPHSKFEPFKVDQKVAMKVYRVGNKLDYKLDKKYTGPYRVSKVQSNDVTK
jgi:transposase InsO family protein